MIESLSELTNTSIPAGVHLRTLACDSDYMDMCAIHNQAARVDNPLFLPLTPGTLAERFPLADVESCRNVFILEMHSEMIGWGSCAVFQQRRDMLVGYYELYLQTAWQNRGIELPVTRILEQRVSELRASHPSPEAVYKLFIPETNLYACGIAEAAGYQQVAEHAMMVRPHLDGIPQAVFPPEIEVRPFAEEHLHQVYEAVTEAFIEHIHGSDPSEEGFQEWCAEDYLQDRSLWVIAWDARSNKIAGLILNFILKDENEYYQRKRGYVEHIAVLKPYRRMGLARAMIAVSLKKHKDRGMHETGLSCHTGNPFNPLSLYFAMGFETRYLLRVYSKPIQPLL